MDKFLNRIDEFVSHINPVNIVVATLLSRVVPSVSASANECGPVCVCIYNPRFDTSDVQFYHYGTPVCQCGHITVSGNAC